MIELEGVSKRFGDLVAVRDLSLRVEGGELFAFLGPNAAGKTTTVRMLCALIGMTSGHASVAGFEVGKQDHQIRCNAGILTEAPGLYDQLSAERNLGFFAQLHDVEDVAAASPLVPSPRECVRSWPSPGRCFMNRRCSSLMSPQARLTRRPRIWCEPSSPALNMRGERSSCARTTSMKQIACVIASPSSGPAF